MGKYFISLAGVAVCFFVMAIPVSAQVQLVFPEQGQSVSFSQLQSPGLSWFAPANATLFEVIITPTNNPSQNLRFETEIKRLELDDSDRPFFTTGSFFWTVRIIEGQGQGTSASGSFKIGTSGSLIPTPTPEATATPVPPDEDTPTPTPTPQVGMPQNFQFDPGQIVTFSNVTSLTISWDPPSAPSGANLVYDVIILFPDKVFPPPIEKLNLPEPNVKPLDFISTSIGTYTVHVRAKDTASGSVSNIATTTFTLSRDVTPSPTATPVVIDSDLSLDGETGPHDLALFAQSFGTNNGEAGFQSKADFTSDGVIDQRDLLMFVSLFKQQGRQSAKPRWLFADVPLMDDSSPICQVVGRRDPIQFPPNEITFGINGKKCTLAEITGTNENFDNGTRFHFSSVSDAVDYQVTIMAEKLGILPSDKFNTGGETSFGLIVTTPDNEANIVVQAIGPNGELGPKSEPLKIVIPAITQ